MKPLFPFSLSFSLLSIFVSLFYSLLVSADDHGVTFLFPTSGLTLSLNDTVNVTYTSNFSVPLLFTFCANTTGENLKQQRVENVEPFNGSQLVQLQWEQPICWFDLRPNSSAGFGANSPAVTILPTPRARPSTVGLPQSIPSSSTPPSPPASSSPSSTPSSSPSTTATSSNQSSSGLSSGAKAGIGVGVALGVVLVGAAIFGFFFLRRRKASNSKASATSDRASSPDGIVEGKWPNYNKVTSPAGVPTEPPRPQELSSDVAYEMPAGETRQEMSSDAVVESDRRRFSWQR
ncbi:hypothetical protein F5884DRAFT_805704 [Xylogone sp. PMI_703]|nr:hypothetical protein F5884DRAFT_805704 [Xylogone sp. PMI_703]